MSLEGAKVPELGSSVKVNWGTSHADEANSSDDYSADASSDLVVLGRNIAECEGTLTCYLV